MLGIPLGTRELVIVCTRRGAGEDVDEEEVGPLGLLTDMGEVIVQHMPHLAITLVDVAHVFPSFSGDKAAAPRYERRIRDELHRLVGAAERNAKIDAAFPAWTAEDAHTAVNAVRFMSLKAYRLDIGERRWELEMG